MFLNLYNHKRVESLSGTRCVTAGLQTALERLTDVLSASIISESRSVDENDLLATYGFLSDNSGLRPLV